MNVRVTKLLVTTASLLMAAGATEAGPTLPQPSTQVSAKSEYYAQSDFTGAGDLTATSATTLPGVLTDVASASVVLSPQPTLTLSISGAGDFEYAGGSPYALATAEYYVQIIGPADVEVPLNVTSKFVGSLSQASGFDYDGEMAVTDQGAGPYGTGYVGYGTPIDSENYRTINFDQTGEFESNVPIRVYLSADLTHYNTVGQVTFNGKISIDPIITIDPTFLGQNPGYSLSFSGGVGDTPSAPEPATWTIMLAGLVAVGAVLRRKADGRVRPALDRREA